MKKNFITYILLLTLITKNFANITNLQEPYFKLSGFTKINFITDTNTETVNTFNITSARIGLKGSITKSINYTISLEPINNASMLYDMFLDIISIPYFNLRVGQFKYKFGLEQTISDPDFELINRSEIVNNLITPSRDIGFEFSKKYLKAFSISS